MKRFFTWEVFRRLLIAFAAFVTLLAVVWAVENFRGNRAWSKYKSELEAKGETLDLKSMVPPPVPDEKNFALSPIFRDLNYSWENQKTGPIEPTAQQKVEVHEPSEGKEVPKNNQDLLDLEEYREFFRGNTNYPQPVKAQSAAEDVLVALTRFEKQFETLHRDAAERPLARFPIHYEDGIQILLPHISTLNSMVRALRLHATACLELKRSDEAFRDAQLVFRMTDSIKEEPLLISYLVRMSLSKQSSLIVKEGLFRHAWSEDQLKQLQDHFAKTDVLTAYQKAMRGERSFANDMMEAMGRGKYSLSDLVNAGQSSQNASANWILPSGWLRQNQRNIALVHQNITLPAVDPEAGRVFPEIVARGEQTVAGWKKGLPNPHNLFAPLLLPAVLTISKRTAEQQTTVDQAILACALERYFLANNKGYPDSLQDLVPKFVNSLPHDVITGAPLKYQRTGNGFYRIYSTGWDGKDDGGKPMPIGTAASEAKKLAHDWVWQYPEN